VKKPFSSPRREGLPKGEKEGGVGPSKKKGKKERPYALKITLLSSERSFLSFPGGEKKGLGSSFGCGIPQKKEGIRISLRRGGRKKRGPEQFACRLLLGGKKGGGRSNENRGSKKRGGTGNSTFPMKNCSGSITMAKEKGRGKHKKNGTPLTSAKLPAFEEKKKKGAGSQTTDSREGEKGGSSSSSRKGKRRKKKKGSAFFR